MLTPSESGIIREGVGVQIILKLWHLFLATRQKAHRYIDQKVPQVEVFYLISYLAISTLIIQMNVCFICRYSVYQARELPISAVFRKLTLSSFSMQVPVYTELFILYHGTV